jgi:hypothetical protein
MSLTKLVAYPRFKYDIFDLGPYRYNGYGTNGCNKEVLLSAKWEPE